MALQITPNLDLDTESASQLIAKVTTFVQKFMSQYDASHDYAHIERVLALTHHIASASSSSSDLTPRYDSLTLTLSALLHDVGDKKYFIPTSDDDDNDGTTLIQATLLFFGAPPPLASKIQTIVNAVSYSSEMVNPSHVRDVLSQYPELGPLQDADRLDALGAVGVGRAFTYGGAKGREMAQTIEHFEEKLVRLEGCMKTERGRELARERTRRVRVFRDWWEEESGSVGADGV